MYVRQAYATSPQYHQPMNMHDAESRRAQVQCRNQTRRQDSRYQSMAFEVDTVYPPSIAMVAPFTYEPARPARNSAAPATSSGVPIRVNGIPALIASPATSRVWAITLNNTVRLAWQAVINRVITNLTFTRERTCVVHRVRYVAH